MRRGLIAAFALAGAMLPISALAHPHVWVTTKSEFVYGAAGTMTAIRNAWSFDEMFSSYAIQGLDVDGDGKLSRAELQELAETNVTTMAESDYFTFADTKDGEVGFAEASDYWLDYDGTHLTLHFTLPLKTAVPHSQPLTVEIYDPTFFVDFELADRTAASLIGAPQGCLASVQRPSETAATGKASSSTKLSEDYFNAPTTQNYGAQFANKIVVGCPS